MNADRNSLERFVDAQRSHIDAAMAELRAGRKRTHWMWFVFPQLRGLGSSHMADFYGIESLDEAKRYLEHPLLGARLRECAYIVTASPVATLFELFGTPDDLKFHSSMTLFAHAEDGYTFENALHRWFAGASDPRTIELLE